MPRATQAEAVDKLIEAVGELRGEVRTGLADIRERMSKTEAVSSEALATARNAGRDAEYAILNLRESFDHKLDEMLALASQTNGAPDRAKIKSGIKWVGGISVLSAVIPAVNWLSLHPGFPHQFLAAIGYAISGIAKVVPGV